MDANGTRFHLLLGRDDWANCTALEPHCGEVAPRTLAMSWAAAPIESNTSGLEWDAEHFQLTLQPRLFQFKSAAAHALALSQRRGAGRDRYGNWYWIADSGQEIRVNSAGTGVSSHFWSAGDGVEGETQPRFGDFAPLNPKPAVTPLPLSGLAVTEDHYLVVGVLQPAGLVIFDLHAGGSPRQMLWPGTVPFAPFDMAPAPGGGVWILDRTDARYWALDRHFNVIRLDQAATTLTHDEFQPIDHSSTRQSATRPFPEAIMLDASSPVAARDPIAIEALPDGTVLILDNTPGQPFSQIFHYRLGEQLGEPVSTDAVLSVVEDEAKTKYHLRGYDFCFVSRADGGDSELLGRLYVAAMDGNQSYAFNVFRQNQQLELQALAEYLPMRLFGGKALVTASMQPNEPGVQQYYDFDESWIPLVEQKRPLYEPAATLCTPIFDGREPDCVWHRLMLDACIPPDSQVQAWSRAAIEKNMLCHAEWFREPDLYLRGAGSEQPYVSQKLTNDNGTWELLFQRARGRYLQLKVTLRGNGRTTPRLRALRAYYPRFSYLEHYLPGVYREDHESASFLERFLANTEGFYTTIEDKIAAAQILFDVRSAPSDALDWLASWFGIALDPVWDDTRRRLFIKHAMDFFQYRGTVRGLLMALHLAFDDCADETLFEPPVNEPSTRRVVQKYPGCAVENTYKILSVKRLHPETIRIIEKYRTRLAPAVVFGDPTELSGPRVVTQTARWQPAQGGAVLSQLYTEALGLSTPTPFPIRDPGGTQSAAWQQFARDNLGFAPSVTDDDLERWQNFLARRYPNLDTLNAAYGRVGAQSWNAFSDAQLPTQLPSEGAPLRDWVQFEGVLLAMRRTAHWFSVLLPAPTNSTDADEHERRRALATRIVNLEKPAHTVFDVKFYWAMFRVGEARLGEDTLIDLGSRAPQLVRPLVLGQGYLSESYLEPGHLQNVADRQVLGRERLSQ